jgi:chromosomal replication initiation ATPase DnaA
MQHNLQTTQAIERYRATVAQSKKRLLKTVDNCYDPLKDEIVKIVCEEFDVRWEKVISKTRKQEVVSARHAYCYLCRMFLPGRSLKVIAADIQRDDHTTVVHAVQSVKDYLDCNDPAIVPPLIRAIKQIAQKLPSHLDAIEAII